MRAGDMARAAIRGSVSMRARASHGKADVMRGSRGRTHRHVVEPPSRHGVARAEHAVEVVRVPIVAYEAKDGEPHLRAKRVAGKDWLRRLGRWQEERLQNQGQREPAADFEVGERVELLIELKGDDNGERAHPDRRVFQHPHLILALLAGWRQPPPSAHARLKLQKRDEHHGHAGEDHATRSWRHEVTRRRGRRRAYGASHAVCSGMRARATYEYSATNGTGFAPPATV